MLQKGMIIINQQYYARQIRKELDNLPFYVKEFYYSNDYSPTTGYQYLTEIRRFFTWLIAEGITDAKENKDISLETLEHMSRETIKFYIDYMRSKTNSQGQPISNAAINRSLNALRSLYHYLTVVSDRNDGEPYFYRNVMSKIKSLKDSQTLNYRAREFEAHMMPGQIKHDFIDFLENQYEKTLEGNKRKLKSYLKNKDRNIATIALMLGTGARVSEIVNANVNDLRLNEMMLDVMRKGGQRDTVPITQWAKPYLQAYLDIREKRYHPAENEKALFLTDYRSYGQRIAVRTIERYVKEYSTAFGRPLTPHKFRHTLASELYDLTKDQVLVSEQLGQHGTSATQLYTHVGTSKQRQAINKLK